MTGSDLMPAVFLARRGLSLPWIASLSAMKKLSEYSRAVVVRMNSWISWNDGSDGRLEVCGCRVCIVLQGY